MIRRIGDFTLKWGESLLWDERRQRLYFADTLGHAIHWLEHGLEPLRSIRCPTMPSGMVNDEMGRTIVTGDDGLYRVDVDRDEWTFLAAYPEALAGRCNDLCADLDGNLITGKLNVQPATGSAWRYSRSGDWTLLDEDISNTNGPTVAVLLSTLRTGCGAPCR